jgi:hypothetical protein
MNRTRKTIIVLAISTVAGLSAFRTAQVIFAKKIKEEKA